MISRPGINAAGDPWFIYEARIPANSIKKPPGRGCLLGGGEGQSTAVSIPYKIALGIHAPQNLMAEAEWNQKQI